MNGKIVMFRSNSFVQNWGILLDYFCFRMFDLTVEVMLNHMSVHRIGQAFRRAHRIFLKGEGRHDLEGPMTSEGPAQMIP